MNTVLIIDDEKPIRNSLSSFLEDFGYQTVTACDGAEGIGHLKSHDVDLILVDLRMPNVDGFGVIEYVASNLPHTPIIVISGAGDIQLVIEAIRKGAWDFITKPVVNLEILQHVATKCLEKAKLLNQSRDYQVELKKTVDDRTKELSEANLSLQQALKRVQEKNREFEEEKEKAEQANQLKSTFLANMSHEIRTPLTGILSFVDLFREEDLSQEDKEKYLDIIHSNSMRLLNLLDDLVEVAKVESGYIEVHKEVIYPAKMIKDLFDLLTPDAKRKGLEFNIDLHVGEDLFFASDKKKVFQILFNILHNAIKFTQEGSVSIMAEVSNGYLKVDIEDSGIGIPENRKEIIFERFRQVENQPSEYEGAGLGLSIAKSYCDLLEGTIDIQSEESKGTLFSVEIPIRVKGQMNHTQGQTEILSFEGHKILIVDDNDSILFYLSRILQGTGIEIFTAQNGEEALDVFLGEKFDVVLMDIKMPKMDGYQAAKEMKSIHPDVPLIAQTAFAQEEHEQKALESGFDVYLKKPIKKEKLITIIQNVLNHQET